MNHKVGDSVWAIQMSFFQPYYTGEYPGLIFTPFKGIINQVEDKHLLISRETDKYNVVVKPEHVFTSQHDAIEKYKRILNAHIVGAIAIIKGYCEEYSKLNNSSEEPLNLEEVRVAGQYHWVLFKDLEYPVLAEYCPNYTKKSEWKIDTKYYDESAFEIIGPKLVCPDIVPQTV